ncbi:MAG TPA: hypothetical protein VEZ40_01865 [Pyrinomonadaceae bacterium]|nr:hypothetical protein [Pyrinomonadaceae bacterium]
MQRLMIFALVFLLTNPGYSQPATQKPTVSDIEVQKSALLSELQILASDSLKLDKPLARALAQAEIADAAWPLDEEWARKLLREAFELTLPVEAEQIRLRAKPRGAPLELPTGEEVSRNLVRGRVLRVANRAHNFGDELVKLSLEKLGSYEAHQNYASLAYQAAKSGDKEQASDYILKAIEADPTYIGTVDVINELAMKDRAAADSLILQYIEQLRRFPLAYANQSVIRTGFGLDMLIYPRSLLRLQEQQSIPPPGAAVMRAYVAYEIEQVGKLKGVALQRARLKLLGIWEPLKKYAPELTARFMELEAHSRAPGDNSPLPTKQNSRQQNKERYEKRLKDALDSGIADDLTINFAISRADFERARKLIAKLPDGARKTQYTDMCNAKEAVSLAARGDLAGAERLAEQLMRATSLLEAYPAIINRCLADKNRTCAASLLVHKAVGQLKRADLTPNTPPAGIPLPVVTNREFDPVLSGLSKLAALIAPLDEQLALEVLDEIVVAANSSALDTEQARTGLDVELFRRLSSKNEVRVRQSAEALKDRLRRIVALAAIYQAQAAALAQQQQQQEAAKKSSLN